MREALERIIRAGIRAPSGDNCQPWRFEVAEDSINVFLMPERDQSHYSWGNRASIIAHGALLENMQIMARSLGYTMSSEEFPDPQQPLFIAHITITQGTPVNEPLADVIGQRKTNRKKYHSTTLLREEKEALIDALQGSGFIIEDPSKRQALARAIAYNEKILFENKHMHHFFFEHMIWPSQKNTGHSIGIPIATLELPPPVKAIWPLLSKWSIMRILSSIGLANGILASNTPIYASGSALLCFTIHDRSEKEYLRIGKILQRTWLTATHLGLQAQILTGIPLLMNQVLHNASVLSPTHGKIIQEQYSLMIKTTGATSPIAFFLRVGQSPPPSSSTPRLPPN
jgi:hypothetical protein